MISLSVIKENSEINISENPNIQLIDIQGLTASDAMVNTTQKIGGTGGIISSTAVRPRNILITISPKNEVEKGRELIYNTFPASDSVTLVIKGKKEISIEGTVEYVRGDLFEQRQSLQISVICPFPYFLDRTKERIIALDVNEPTTVEGLAYTKGCIIEIWSETPIRGVTINQDYGLDRVNNRWKFSPQFQAYLREGSTNLLAISSIEGEKGIISHSISDVYTLSKWITPKPGYNLISLTLEKDSGRNGYTTPLTAEELEGVQAQLREPIYYGGI